MTDDTRIFPIRYGAVSRAMVVLGFTRRNSRAALEGDVLDVSMGWGFRMRAPRSAVRTAAPDDAFLLDRGVHGWFGRWNVAGSARGLVRIAFDPPVPARVGPVGVRVRRLRVSLEEPEEFLLALGAPPTAG